MSRQRLPEPAAALLEEAAEASKVGLRARRERALATARPIVQTAVAASTAWFVATELLGHSQAFFAPISAVVTLGLTVHERRRRAFELAIGVSVGIAIADVLVAAIGTGTWQVGVVTALAMLAATIVGGGPLLATQAGASAVLVATLQPPDGAFDFSRALDALVGAASGLAIGSLLLPANPLRLALGGPGQVIDSLAHVLDHISAAAEQRDADEAERALAEVARLRPQHDALEDTLAEAAATARTSLGRREALDLIAQLSELARHLRLALADARSLARGIGRAIDLEDATPPELGAAIRALAESARAMHAVVDGGDPERAREAAVRAAGLANAVLAETTNLSAVHCVGQVRLLAVDLLRASGVEREAAQAAIRTATHP